MYVVPSRLKKMTIIITTTVITTYIASLESFQNRIIFESRGWARVIIRAKEHQGFEVEKTLRRISFEIFTELLEARLFM